MLRRDPTPIGLTDDDVNDVKEATAKWMQAHRSPNNNEAVDPDVPEAPVNALEKAKQKKQGKTTAQRIGLQQCASRFGSSPHDSTLGIFIIPAGL
ncbi:hypothetical protein RhiJN_21781 [Ceratobasidium sp. AG-Ba]|nr:hypothetical protein RhiJN_21781 [Ceratobasidium sp. AG-Ba]